MNKKLLALAMGCCLAQGAFAACQFVQTPPFTDYFLEFYGTDEDVKAWLAAGVDKSYAMLVLGSAVEYQKFDVVELIIASGVDVKANLADSVWTPLHHAAFNDVKYAKALLAAG